MKTNTDQIIAEHFIDTNINEAVQIIEKLDYDDIAQFIQEMPLDFGSKVILHMNNYKVAKCLELIEMDFAVKLIGSIDLLPAELILRQCDEGFRDELLNKMAPNIANKIRRRLRYGINSIGTCMKSKVFSLQKENTVSEAMELMKKEGELITSEIFVINEHKIIEGIVKIEQLVLANENDLIASILIKDIPDFFADDTIQTIIEHPAWITYRTLPVIGESKALIGSLRFEDLSKRNLKRVEDINRGGEETLKALGELYVVGLTGLLLSFGKTE